MGRRWYGQKMDQTEWTEGDMDRMGRRWIRQKGQKVIYCRQSGKMMIRVDRRWYGQIG